MDLGLRGQEDADEAERAIERAVELGINFIDCANIYGFGDVYETRGTSEQVLARRPQAAPRRPCGHLKGGQSSRRRAQTTPVCRAITSCGRLTAP